MNGTGNFKASRSSENLVAVLLLALVSAGALVWSMVRGYTLYYGDAVAHLNIARRIVDSRTPGLDQLGTVWLPLPHLLMLPFVGNDFLWRSGLAGAIPAALSFIAAGALLFAAARRAFDDRIAGAVALAAFALNPNVLYMQSIPMTETVFFAAFALALYCMVAFWDDGWLIAAAGAGAGILAASLTRYEGWFLIPFVTLFFFLTGGSIRWAAAIVFTAIASAGPVAWLAHDLWHYGDPLAFYRGPWSAIAIYQRALESGMQPYAGDGDWLQAIQYYGAAARLCAGWPLCVLGLAGIGAGIWKRKIWLIAFAALPPVFYVWSVYSSGTPVFVPHLWPNTYYNIRYGLAALPLLALGAGALVLAVPARWRWAGAAAAGLVLTGGWLLPPGTEASICWKEAQVNSEQRREWTRQAADLLRANYRGGGIIAPFGDVTGVFLEAGIPLRETLHSGNAPAYAASLARPDLFLSEKWAVAISGDEVATAILRAQRDGPRYECVKMISLAGGPVIEIHRRIP